ncbi:MAG: hypothetical protein P1P90_01500 [Patescibacteria group bacterium]|nr:hypothetical protein [Patescibacteria group bacterium]
MNAVLVIERSDFPCNVDEVILQAWDARGGRPKDSRGELLYIIFEEEPNRMITFDEYELRDKLDQKNRLVHAGC